MRVIAGIAKGHKLFAPEGIEARPTSDKLKGSLFSMLHDFLPDAQFLDLFSGTGAIGIEALSRGASSCVFVENSKKNIELINKNLTHTKMMESSRVLNFDYKRAIAILGSENKCFDIIFLDPPYNKNLVFETLVEIVRHNLLKPDGIIVAETSNEEIIPNIEGLSVYKAKKYRIASFVFWSGCKEESKQSLEDTVEED